MLDNKPLEQEALNFITSKVSLARAQILSRSTTTNNKKRRPNDLLFHYINLIRIKLNHNDRHSSL